MLKTALNYRGNKNRNKIGTHPIFRLHKWDVSLFFTAFLFFICYSIGTVADGIDYAAARQKMVQEQLVARGIKDKRVLDVMGWVERHKFVPEKIKEYAYEDTPLSIGKGQTISQPYIVALMTELLELKGDGKILEIGTGSGYQAAILAELTKEVYTVEIIESLGKEAEERLKELGYTNIKVKIGDGYYGWQEYAPFDAIIVTAAADAIPQPLIDQIKVGGRLVIPIGDEGEQKLLLIQKQPGGKLKKNEITGVLFVPLVGEHPNLETKKESELREEQAENKKWVPSENKKWKKKQQ